MIYLLLLYINYFFHKNNFNKIFFSNFYFVSAIIILSFIGLPK